MLIATIHNLIKIEIDDSYPWKDTLFINSDVASFDQASNRWLTAWPESGEL